MGRPELNENVRTLWSALQEELQGLNRATRAMEIGTAEQNEHGASNTLGALPDQARKNTSASVPMAADRAVRRWASRYAELNNPACSHPRRRNSKALTERVRNGYSRHKNRMGRLYWGTLKEVLPRSETLVNAVRRFGAGSLVKRLPEKSNPGPRGGSDRDCMCRYGAVS